MGLADKRPCAHASTTLVQSTFNLVDFDEQGQVITVIGEDLWFACWQCDECGTITQKAVTSEDLEEAHLSPWLDEDSYQRVTVERMDEDLDYRTLQFMSKAVWR